MSTPAYAAARAHRGLVAALLLLAALSWVWSLRAMQGMDAGPWTALGGLGWFVGIWVVMMTAMMFPSVAPTVALYARMTRDASPASPWLFGAGYLLTWTGGGLVAYAVGVLVTALAPGDALSWGRAGRALAGVTLLVAAAYELSPLKGACLARCRSPLGALLGSWRDGRLGAVRMGLRNGAWCVGCCWTLMASLFALGVMSVSWMALVAGIITVQKLLPWSRPSLVATSALLVTLGIVLLVAPESLPGLTIPTGGGMSMG